MVGQQLEQTALVQVQETDSGYCSSVSWQLPRLTVQQAVRASVRLAEKDACTEAGPVEAGGQGHSEAAAVPQGVVAEE